MDVDSDSSSGSVIITGPIPEYPELRRRPVRTSVPAKKPRNADHQNKRKELVVDITQDEKVDKIQKLEDLVKASATLPRSGDNREDDVDAWSGSDTKSIKGSGKRDPASKYLKKIKTLQQNKRRQETRISRLTKEVRSLRDKVSVQAAYIDVLCGMLGDDMKEKFRDRQGMGVLGNTKLEDDNLDGITPIDRGENGTWFHDDAVNDKVSGSDGVLKEKEHEYYCIEDLDEVEENGMSRSGSSEDLKVATEVKDETMADEVMARPLDVAGPSTSYGSIGNRINSKDRIPDEMNALTISVGSMKQDSVHNQVGNASTQCDGENMGQVEIHHGVFGAPYERRICNFEGQVGESVFMQVPRVTSKAINPYEEMRVQLAYVKPHMEPMPPMISYGMIMGNHGLNLLPAVHPTTDDPLNIGTEDASSFGPLIITTSLDPLNLISHASTSDRMKIRQATTSSHDPLNIESEDILIDDPRELPDEADPIGSNRRSSALLISIPSSSAESDNHLSEMARRPGEAEEPQPTTADAPDMSPSAGEAETDGVPTNPKCSGNASSHLNLLQNSQVRSGLDMPQISDALVRCTLEPQDDDSENISQPQAIVDHLINNIPCDIPELRLE